MEGESNIESQKQDSIPMDEIEAKAIERLGRVYDAKNTNTERMEVLLIQLGLLKR